MSYTKDSTKTYTFGKVSFDVKNYRGVYFLSDSVKSMIKELSVDDAKVANKEAWKKYKDCCKAANRCSNASISGNLSMNDEYGSHADVAQQIIKFSYKRMMGYN